MTAHSAGDWTWSPAPASSAVVRLWAHGSRLWAGGAGGIAVRDGRGTWRAFDGPLRYAAAFAAAGSDVVVGGVDGIAVGDGRGGAWRPAELEGGGAPVAALLATDAGTLLAGTLGAAVLRSTDGGRRWHRSAFGLGECEVSALAAAGDTILAATDHGVFRSGDDGRSWRFAADVGDVSCLDLCAAGELAVVTTEHQGLFVSTDAGRHWQVASAPDGAGVTALGATMDGAVLAGTGDGLLFRSTDAGATWSALGELGAAVLTVCPTADGVAIGTAHGLWRLDAHGPEADDPPPVGDLRRLVLAGERLLLTGPEGGLVDTGLPTADAETPTPRPLLDPPVTAVTGRGDGSVVAATTDRLLQSADLAHWDVLGAPPGVIEHLSFAADLVTGYAAAAGATALACTRDGGRTWRAVELPWHGEWVVAVQAVGTSALVASWDPSRQWLRVWLLDAADAWSEGPALQTAAPRVSTCGEPSAFAVARSVHVVDADGAWVRTADPGAAVQRLRGHGTVLVAQTAAGVERWDPAAAGWTVLGPPDDLDPVVDLGLTPGALWTVHASGRLRRRPLD